MTRPGEGVRAFPGPRSRAERALAWVRDSWFCVCNGVGCGVKLLYMRRLLLAVKREVTYVS